MSSLKLISTSVLTVFVFTAMAACDQTDTVSSERSIAQLAKPTPQQLLWQDAEIGMFIHFGLETWQDQEHEDDPKMENLKLFDPPNVDTDQWVDVAESMGAKHIILVAKHVGGFCLWQTDSTEYSIKNSPYKNGKGDILAELAKSCRKKGMNLGVYIYPGSLFHGSGIGTGGKTRDPARQKEYTRIYRRQLTEVLSRYGTMFELWYDGSCIVPAGDIIARYAPNTIVFQGQYQHIGNKYTDLRWVGNERGWAPYPAFNAVSVEAAKSGTSTARDGDPYGEVWLPLECCTVIRNAWFWNTYNLDTLRELTKLKEIYYNGNYLLPLMDTYYHSVGHGAGLLLNVNPDRSGRIPEPDARRAAEFGAEIKRRFAKSLMETSGSGDILQMSLGKPTLIDHVITQELIAHGQRILEYVIEGRTGDTWKPLARGSSIGHKKIDWFEPVSVSEVRLRVIKSIAKPMIRKLAVYHVGVIPDPNNWKSVWSATDDPDEIVSTWSPESVSAKWTTLEIDLTDHVQEPTQYEVVFEQTGGQHQIEIKSVALVLAGQEVPGFVGALDKIGTFNISLTATPAPGERAVLLRDIIRARGDSTGNIRIRKARDYRIH